MTQYDYRIDLDDLNATHVRQLRLIGRGKSVLELGCAAGVMTKLIKAQDCRVTGIELDEGEAAKAREFAERVHIANLDDPAALDVLGDEKFDVVLAGDVLEHLRDPAAVMPKLSSLLSETGYIVASIPNIAHASIRLALLQGRWDYADYGLLDRTHLRFFTHSSVDELFAGAGMRIERMEQVKVSPFDLDPLLQLKDFPPAVIEMVTDDEEAATIHYVVAAVPADRPGHLELEPEPDWDTVQTPTEKKTRAKVRPVEPAGPTGRPQVAGVRALAFYLPQFHPTPENDAWWGKGFTEWTNVTKAKPIWPGHYQPRVPADLGFYDLRLPEVRAAQAKLARENGISAFVYHHYWFSGRRLLNRPFEEVLASGSPNFPFALCWANESWSRIWDGGDRLILVDQDYKGDEAQRHAAWLAKAFNDPRYVRVDGRPVFVIYNVANLPPDPRAYLDKFREACRTEAGVDPYLIQAITHSLDKKPAQTGADAEVEFPPHRLGDKVKQHPDPRLAAGSHQRFEYEDVTTGCLDRLDVPWTRHPGIVPSWDNTARRKVRATILHGANPEAYEKWLLAAAEHEAKRRPDNGLVFINAWNEWAEGAYLEPDQRFGHGYLEATRRVFGQLPEPEAPAVEATAQPGALPADYLALRDRVVELEIEAASAYNRGQEASRAADRKATSEQTREIARLHNLITTITNGARQTAEWAKNLDKQLREKAEAMAEIGHWARSMEVEVENKNLAIADGTTYARKLETEVAAKNRQIDETASYARKLEAELLNLRNGRG